jgi:hypothetical protein|tara:strand:- start:445 stop:894 length:450 start_codon:yes stop_codon:yes gene_type:complete
MRITLSKVEIDSVEQKEKRKYLFFISISVLTLGLILFYFPIEQYHYFPPCPWNSITGTFCPGCGTVRGIQSTLNGNLLGLLQNNPLAMLSLPILTLSFFSLFSQGILGFKPFSVVLSKNEILIIFVVILVYWIIRNFWTIFAPIPIIIN